MSKADIVQTGKITKKTVAPEILEVVDLWEDIPDTYDKPKLCKIEDPDCEACQ